MARNTNSTILILFGIFLLPIHTIFPSDQLPPKKSFWQWCFEDVNRAKSTTAIYTGATALGFLLVYMKYRLFFVPTETEKNIIALTELYDKAESLIKVHRHPESEGLFLADFYNAIDMNLTLINSEDRHELNRLVVNFEAAFCIAKSNQDPILVNAKKLLDEAIEDLVSNLQKEHEDNNRPAYLIKKKAREFILYLSKKRKRAH